MRLPRASKKKSPHCPLSEGQAESRVCRSVQGLSLAFSGLSFIPRSLQTSVQALALPWLCLSEASGLWRGSEQTDTQEVSSSTDFQTVSNTNVFPENGLNNLQAHPFICFTSLMRNSPFYLFCPKRRGVGE